MPGNQPERSHQPAAVAVPPGAPHWVTLELIEQTIQTWQPFYADQLIPEDALGIIMGVSRMVNELSNGDSHEAIRRTRTGKQPRARA